MTDDPEGPKQLLEHIRQRFKIIDGDPGVRTAGGEHYVTLLDGHAFMSRDLALSETCKAFDAYAGDRPGVVHLRKPITLHAARLQGAHSASVWRFNVRLAVVHEAA